MALISAVDFLDALDHPETSKVKIPEAAARCPTCKVVLHEVETGLRRRGDGSFVCGDCYFEEMGDALEAFPILPPRIRRRSSPNQS
jgi:hypothetical protein